MLMSDCAEQFWDVFVYFMSSFSETADAETPRAARASVCMVCSKPARLCHSLTEMQNMQDSYLNSVLCQLKFIDTSP